MIEAPEKKEWILAHERRMAAELASRVIPRPSLNLWMILIPVIFVFYFWQLNRYAAGRKEFMAHWMRPRATCLEDACRRLAEEHPPSSPVPRKLHHLIPAGAVPDEALVPYERWLRCLYGHYADLLAAPGADHTALVRNAYRRRGNYLLFLNHLGDTEHDLNTALLDHGKKMDAERKKDQKDAARRIESISRDLRRKDAEALFS